MSAEFTHWWPVASSARGGHLISFLTFSGQVCLLDRCTVNFSASLVFALINVRVGHTSSQVNCSNLRKESCPWKPVYNRRTCYWACCCCHCAWPAAWECDDDSNENVRGSRAVPSTAVTARVMLVVDWLDGGGGRIRCLPRHLTYIGARGRLKDSL